MALKKYGSDPSGSRVNNLERGEAENQVKSAMFNDEGGKVLENLPNPDLSGERDWTPLYGDTTKAPPYAKKRSDQKE